MPKNSKKTAQSNSALARNITVFVEGVAFTRSFTHPYIGERIDPLWVLRDAPRKNAKDYRREEWSAYKTPAVVVDKLVRAHTRGSYAICAFHAIDTSDESLRAEYKALGYRLGCTEGVMVHALKQIPSIKSPALIQRVLTTELADAVNKVAGSRQILPEHLTDNAPMHLYAAMIDGAVVGWVGSIKCQGGSWVANMFVLEAHRRQKIASALLVHMMRDERKRGMNASVLTSSKAGAKLYTTIGYQSLGSLLLFTPKQ
jgi:GNAT superfamily N-acetyltransferase|uniref:GNAT family N-acetyltransferase n=1 Tax=Cephaloticoccus sp. TaxID=1985742 RepID=UPI00404AE274